MSIQNSPEPNLSISRLELGLQREMPADYQKNPTVEGTFTNKASITYPLLLVSNMQTVKVKQVLDSYLDNVGTENGLDICLAYKAIKNGSSVVALWRKTKIDIRFLGLLEAFFLECKYYESKGVVRDIVPEDFLDLDRIKSLIIPPEEPESTYDEEKIDYTENLFYAAPIEEIVVAESEPAISSEELVLNPQQFVKEEVDSPPAEVSFDNLSALSFGGDIDE